jgi:hypothetical protein
MRKRIGAALLIASLALAPAVAFAGAGDPSLEQLVVEMAKTPADHAALAKHFRAKAEAARAAAARHERMGSAYTAGKLMERERMREHCNKIAASNRAIATEYDELAKVHDAEAKKTP